MARDRWSDERDRWHRRGDPERGRGGRGYDPYDPGPYEPDRDVPPDYPPYAGAAGIPGALGMGGRYYTGGGAFGSRGREDVAPPHGRRGDFRGRPDDDRGFWDKASDEVQSWMGDDEAERRRRMDHQRDNRGLGPKGYVRSDARIDEDVHDRLTEDWVLDASEIEVSVSDREVTLNGTVDNRHDKRRAEDIAESVSGVTHVQNNLRVRSQLPRAESPVNTG